MQRISLNKSRNASLGWRNASMGVWYHPSYGHKHSEYLLFIPRKTVASRIGHHGVTNRSSRGDESQVWGLYFNFTLVIRKNKIYGHFSTPVIEVNWITGFRKIFVGRDWWCNMLISLSLIIFACLGWRHQYCFTVLNYHLLAVLCNW